MPLYDSPPFPLPSRLAGGASADFDAAGLARLRRIVAGLDGSWPRSRAMALLAHSDLPARHRDFESLLCNDREAPAIRRLAAFYLGRIGTPAALDILIRATKISDEQAQIGVAEALGRMGDAVALKALAAARRRARGAAAAAADFAMSLISYRIGCPGYDLPIPAGTGAAGDPAPSCPQEVAGGPADAADAGLCLHALGQDPYGMELMEGQVYELRCGERIWMLAFNRALVSAPGLVETLAARKTMLGLVAQREVSEPVCSTAYLVLTSPAGKGGAIDLLLYRLAGVPELAARLSIKLDRGLIRVASPDGPADVRVTLRGPLGDGLIEADVGLRDVAPPPRQAVEQFGPASLSSSRLPERNPPRR